MSYKLKYSSLLSLKKKTNSVLYLKGPLGINYLKIPNDIHLLLDNSQRLIIVTFIKSKNIKKSNLTGFLSILQNSCRTLVFGDLIGLHIEGLGLKFLKLNKSLFKKEYLVMSLGYSDLVNFIIDRNRSIFFFKDIRNIYIFSTDYSYLMNEISTLISLKKPDKFRKRKNGITLNFSVL